MTSAVESKVARFTVCPAATTLEPRRVVVLPLGASLLEGFRRARLILPEPVRLVGQGITLESTWPEWVHSDGRGLWLTELGAYRVGEEVEPTAPLRRALSGWSRRVFGDLCEGVPGGEAMYGSAAARLLQDTFEMRTTALGVVERHRGDQVEIVGGRWDDVAQRLGKRPPWTERAARRLFWPPWLAAHVGVALGGTVVRTVQTFRAGAETRARLRDLRARPAPQRTGDVWVGLIPDLTRANAHVVESCAREALAQDRLRGVLLVDSLQDGLRTETRLETRRAEDFWPGLGLLRSEIGRLEVDQAVGAETWPALVENLVRAAGASAVAAWRLGREGPEVVEEGDIRHDLFRQTWRLASLATLDLARAIAATRAARGAASRLAFGGAKVVFPSCTLSHLAAPCLVLNDAGATTVDFFHGAGIEHVPGPVESPAQVHATWTKLDADVFVAMGKQAVEGGMPVRVQPRKPAREKRILFLTSYAHRDEPRPVALPFQNELIRVATLAPAGYEFLWRPHPADSPASIEQTLAAIARVPVSSGRTLEQDIAWADVVVSGISTALFESLFAEIPVFAHVPPMREGLHVFSFIAPERIFYRAEDVWPRLLAVFEDRERGLDTTAPERRARRILFGGDGGMPSAFDLELGGSPVRRVAPPRSPTGEDGKGVFPVSEER